MLCPMTGSEHELFWMRSAWWCRDCRQKIETCCEGACPSVADGRAEEMPRPVAETGAVRPAA
jgi:hypothetical protein